jgi:hypothetical protein
MGALNQGLKKTFTFEKQKDNISRFKSSLRA